MGAMDSGRSGKYTNGLVIDDNGILKLEYTYWYEESCNCHPETCCCGGVDTVFKKHKLPIINTDDAIIGEMMRYKVSNTKVIVIKKE